MVASVRGFTVMTRCKSVDDFIDTFHDRTQRDSIFVHTVDARVVGTECGFAILLADRKPVLAGTCVVLQVFRDNENPYRRPGMLLGIQRLGPESQAVFSALDAAREMRQAPDTFVDDEPPVLVISRTATEPLRVAELPRARTATPPATAPVEQVVRRATERMGSRELTQRVSTVQIPPRQTMTVQVPPLEVPPVAVAPLEPARAPRATSAPEHVRAEGSTETRTPGSSLVLPANPLMNMSDGALEGLVECRLFEATSAMLPAPAPPVVEVPVVEAPAAVDSIPEPIPYMTPQPMPAPRLEMQIDAPVAAPVDAPVVASTRATTSSSPRRTRIVATLEIAAALAAVVAMLVMRGAPSAMHGPSVDVDAVEEVGIAVRATTGLAPLPPAPPKKKQPMHAVLVRTYPVGARVVVDGRFWGTTPTYARIPANTPTEVLVTRAGYQPVTQTVTSTTRTDRVVIGLKKANPRRARRR